MSPRTPCLLALSLLLAIAAPAQTPDEGIVRDFWPSRLGKDVEKLFDFARADLDGTGRGDYIVAIYGNSPCVVRVLRAAGGAPSLVAEAAPDAMGGHAPRLRLVDLDGDGRPEIVAAFATITGGEVTWIFRWSGSALTLYGPTVTTGRRSVTHSVLGRVELFDIDGDGIADIVEFGPDNDGKLWKRSPDGTYRVARRQILYVNRFERHPGEPELFTALFRATPGQQLVVTIVNGDKSGEHRVTSGDLYVNGKRLFGNADFKKNTRLLRATITAKEINEVESRLDGKPGAAMTVSIAPEQ